MKYRTLGDILGSVQEMKDSGMTRSSVLYVIDRVYYDLGDTVYHDDPATTSHPLSRECAVCGAAPNDLCRPLTNKFAGHTLNRLHEER